LKLLILLNRRESFDFSAFSPGGAVEAGSVPLDKGSFFVHPFALPSVLSGLHRPIPQGSAALPQQVLTTSSEAFYSVHPLLLLPSYIVHRILPVPDW